MPSTLLLSVRTAASVPEMPAGSKKNVHNDRTSIDHVEAEVTEQNTLHHGQSNKFPS